MRLAVIAIGLNLMLGMGCNGRVEHSEATKPSEPLTIYQHTVYGHDDARDRVDTLARMPRADETYVMLDTTLFTLFGKQHVVRGYSNELTYEIDVYRYVLELDTVGMIYDQSLSWPGNFSFIHTNNDSLNLLISAAIGAAFRPRENGAHFSYERAKEARRKVLGE